MLTAGKSLTVSHYLHLAVCYPDHRALPGAAAHSHLGAEPHISDESSVPSQLPKGNQTDQLLITEHLERFM